MKINIIIVVLLSILIILITINILLIVKHRSKMKYLTSRGRRNTYHVKTKKLSFREYHKKYGEIMKFLTE